MALLMKRLAVFLLLALLLPACAGMETHSPLHLEDLGPEVVWQADMATIRKAVSEQCPQGAPLGADECFLRVMELLGASPAAIRFAASFDSPVYLHAFHQAGPVGVGFMHYSFRADERYGYAILNGNPSPVDVDAREFLPLKALEADSLYRAVKRDHPDVSVWPGDRGGPGHMAARELDEGGMRFVIGYELRDGCRACESIGSVDFAFDFDGEGNFLGSSPFSLGEVIHTSAGRSVTITLETAHTESGRWQMVRLPPPDLLRLESKAVSPAPRRGVRENETWTFLAEDPGRILVSFRRVIPDADTSFPNARATFLLVIHQDEETMSSALADAFQSIINRELEELGSPRAGKVALSVKGVWKDLARVDIRPSDPVGEEWAMIYLRRRHGEWRVLGVGQSFSASFYDRNAIPPELRGPVDTDSAQAPPLH